MTTNSLNQILWGPFGAAIVILQNAISMCPEYLWNTPAMFWYNAYHTIFYLDYYLTTDPLSFTPPQPYTLSKFEADGVLPERVYTKAELLEYAALCREKCRKLIASLNEETFNAIWQNKYRSFNMLELLLYNMRHVQHHTAQLNLLLRQGMDNAPRWVSRTSYQLNDDNVIS